MRSTGGPQRGAWSWSLLLVTLGLMGCGDGGGDPAGLPSPPALPPLEATLILASDSMRMGETVEALLRLEGGDPADPSSWHCDSLPAEPLRIETTPDGCRVTALNDGDPELRVVATRGADSTTAAASLRVRTPEPRVVGTLMDIAGQARGSAWVGDPGTSLALLSEGGSASRLSVVDVSDRGAPRTVAWRVFSMPPGPVDVAGSLAAVVVGTRGLLMVDISDPLDFEVLFLEPEFFPPDTRLSRILIEGDDLFVASHSRGLHRVDIRDPRSPRLHSTLQVDPPRLRVTTDVAFHENHLLVGVSGVGVAIMQKVEHEEGHDEWVRVATLPSTGWVRFALEGSTAWVASFEPGEAGTATLSGWSLADPHHPEQLSFVELAADEVTGMLAAPGRLFVSAWNRGLLVLDTSEPGAPVVMGSLAPGASVGTPLPAFPHLIVFFSRGFDVVDLGPWVPITPEPASEAR